MFDLLSMIQFFGVPRSLSKDSQLSMRDRPSLHKLRVRVSAPHRPWLCIGWWCRLPAQGLVVLLGPAELGRTGALSAPCNRGLGVSYGHNQGSSAFRSVSTDVFWVTAGEAQAQFQF